MFGLTLQDLIFSFSIIYKLAVLEKVMEVYEDKKFNVRLEARLKNATLVKARETLGLTQKAAAELMGIPQNSLSTYELLKGYPDREIQEKICSTYRSLGYFILEEDTFPDRLRDFKVKGKFIAEREIPYERLLSLSTLSSRLLPVIQAEAAENIYAAESEEAARESLSELSERQQRVLSMRYGIGRARKYTYKKIGKKIGVSTERVRQIEIKALRDLKAKLKKRKVTEI